MKDKLLIKSIFYTIQGEGMNAGMPAIFVRLGNCNLRCSFCDTDFLTDLKEMTIDEVVDEVMGFECRNIVFTGGEPLLQQELLVKLMVKLLESNRYYFAVETNGTIAPSFEFEELIDFICCSPKTLVPMVKTCSELKVVWAEPYISNIEELKALVHAKRYYVSPCAPSNNPYTKQNLLHGLPYPANSNVDEVIEFVKDNPEWYLNLQSHKILGLE